MTKLQNGKELAATIFPITGLSNTRYRFKILRVREPIPEDNRQPIRLQRWADQLWRGVLHCPVYPTKRFGFPAFLIPELGSHSDGDSIEILDVPDKTYHIDVTEDVVDIDIEHATGFERELICRMLERPFTDKLRAMVDFFWKDQWTLFYLQKPVNSSAQCDIMNAYKGFKFSVIFVEDTGLFLAVDVRTRYVGRKPLSEHSEEERREILNNHLDLDSPYEDRARFLRDNGTAKFPCKYTGDTGQTVSQYRIDDSGTTVLQYYQRRYPKVSLESEDHAVFVKDQEKKENLAAPASRMFPIFTTEYEGVRNCSVQPQMTPKERVFAIQDFLKHLRGVRYGDTSVTVNQKIFGGNRTVFAPPRLEFGNGYIHQPFQEGDPPIWSDRFDSLVVKWRSKKLLSLYQNGPYHNEPLPGIVLLYPQSMQRPMRETFIKELKQEIKLQTEQDIQIVQQRHYQVGRNERMGSSLRMLGTEILGIPRCLAVIVLWDRLYKNIHGILKETLRATPSQCAWEKTVMNICNQDNPQRAQSQLRNLALGVLIEAGVQPWVLADPLHHDLHIGIDLLYGRIGYHFLYGTGGRKIDTYFGSATQRGRMHEAIKRPELRNRLIQSIKAIVDQGHSINSIVIHRDGRWWPRESDGLREALDRLKTEGILAQHVRCTIVEIKKNHMPIRVFTSSQGQEMYFQNPLPGTYIVLDAARILLTTTGRPGAWDERGGRTASTLLLEVVEMIGDFKIEEIARDAYYLTHLNWSAPDIDISLPVTIRWNDDLLRETLWSPSQEDEDMEEYSEGEEEGQTYSEDEI